MLSLDAPILVTGVKGQLGYDVVKQLQMRGFKNVIGIDKEELDLIDEEAVRAFVRNLHPQAIFHNAAWTAVDKAETCPELVYQINALAPKYLAEAAEEVGAKIVAISTDYVYSGTGVTPFCEKDPVGPTSVYGKTKFQGEEFVRLYPKHFIVRISWVFGINGQNFIKTMLRLGQTHSELSVVSDQIGSPTYTVDLARLLVDMAQSEEYGTYNASNEGFTSWSDFAKAIFAEAKMNVEVHPVSTEEYRQMNPNQAARPLNSRMSKDKLVKHGFLPLPSWQDALKRYLKELEVLA